MIEHCILGHFAHTYSTKQIDNAISQAFPGLIVGWEVKKMSYQSLNKHFLYFTEEDYTLLLLSIGAIEMTARYIRELLKVFSEEAKLEKLNDENLQKLLLNLERHK